MRYFDSYNVKVWSVRQSVIVKRMHAAKENQANLPFYKRKLRDARTGPAAIAKVCAKLHKRGIEPAEVLDGCKFESTVRDAPVEAEDYKSTKGMNAAIWKQDERRATDETRLPGPLMYSAILAAGAHCLALPPATETAIVSAAATRALGFAPLVPPPSVIACGWNELDEGEHPSDPIVID